MNTLQEKHDYFKNGMAELQDFIDAKYEPLKNERDLLASEVETLRLDWFDKIIFRFSILAISVSVATCLLSLSYKVAMWSIQ